MEFNETLTSSCLILEDEPEICEDIEHRIRSLVDEIDESYKLERIGSTTNLHLDLKVLSTDNLMEAKDIVLKGKCDILFTDFKVNADSNRNGFDNALNLLRNIKKSKAFIPAIGHSAVISSINKADCDKLTMFNVSKEDLNSIQVMVEKGRAIIMEVFNYKKFLLDAFLKLSYAAIETDLTIKQDLLNDARKIFFSISLPAYIPDDYKKALTLLHPILLRFSSISSDYYGLNDLSIEFIKIISPLIHGLTRPIFSFEKDALPIFSAAEAAGYKVFMRIGNHV